MMHKLITLLVVTAAALFAAELKPVAVSHLGKADQWTVASKVTVEDEIGPEDTPAIKILNLPNGTATLNFTFSDEIQDSFDNYQGISFAIKGDGSDCWAPICFTSGRYSSYTYLYFVPLKNTEWKRYTVAWQDLIPESASGPIGAPDGLPPCGLLALRIGCRWKIWYDNAPIPAHSISIADLKFEPVIDRPAVAQPVPAGFGTFLNKLADRRPVRIQCQGDSITAGTSLGDKVNERYSFRAEKLLREWLDNNAITCVNRAVGGARTNDMRAWLDRDFNGPIPDLVTIWCGYNDKSGCITKAYYKSTMADYIDRVARKTQGKAAILLFATGPGKGARYTMMDDFAEAIRELGDERNLPVFDINALFKQFGKAEFSDTYMADTAHPNAAGHQFVADELCKFLITQAGITTPRPVEPVVENHTSYDCDFEGDTTGWIFEANTGITDEKAKGGKKSLRLTCLKDDNKDHLRAWSPVITVKAGQQFVISGDTCQDLTPNNYGVYVAECSNEDGSIANCKLIPVTKKYASDWTHFKNTYKVPPTTTGAIRILFWAFKSTVGEVYLDNLSVQPK